MEGKSGTMAGLEKDLETFDRIILVDPGPENRRFVDLLYGSEALKAFRGKILILSGREDGRRDNAACRDKVSFQPNVTCRHITEEERREILDLYHMYEFSDRFSVCSQDEKYGGLWNLVRTGILTEEEAAAAFLWEA